MQGQVGKETSDLVNEMVTCQHDKSLSGLNRSQKIDQRGRCGTCNVCSAPCSSCFHVDKVLLKSNDESTMEACADNIVVSEHRRYESGQMSEVTTVAGSFSEHSMGKGSPNTYEAFPSNDNVVHLKHGVSEAHDDCLSCASGTDELASTKDELVNSLIKYDRKCKSSIDSHNQESSLCSKRDQKDDKPSDTKYKLYDSPTKHLTSVLNREAENGAVCGDIHLSATNSIKKNEDLVVEILPTDEADDSGMMELDVNVCDICGDAGKEHLLAVCSRCSDGAEHTYCMRIKLDKVPEVEWFCEECNSMVEKDNGRLAKPRKLDYNEKVNFSNQLSSEQANSSDFLRNRTKGEIKCTGKRRRDDTDAEVSSIVKIPATMHKIGSPKTKAINLGTRAPSSLDSSLKNQDKGRLKSSHLASSNPARVNDITESADSDSDLRTHSFRGTLSKSMSFNSLASKPKVKRVEQAVLQRQKSAKEQASFRPRKDGVARMIGKSMSFKSTTSIHSESKTKKLSPRSSHIHDNRNIKDRISIERQHSFRSEQPLANSIIGNPKNVTSRIEKPAAARGDPFTPVAIVNQREKKYDCTDGKSVAVSRSFSFIDRRSIKSSSSLGEFKRPSVSTFDVSYTIGCNNIGQKSIPKEDISSCPVAERSHTSAERMKEHLGSRFQPSSMRSSRDEPKKPGVHRKHKMPGQTDGSCISIADPDNVSHQGSISSSIGTRRSYSVMEHPEETKSSRNMNAYSLKQETISDVKESSFINSERFLSEGDGAEIVPSFRDELNNVSIAGPSFVNSAAIPEHEYIWQGSFEINQSGRCFELWDGIQAHFSTGASPKVVHAVKKFESRITLHEVPRLSTWPVQFREHGVKEDNIALFFFARDIESYNKNYKILVDKMMTNDLALKGNLNGVDLLIFPSSQLPDNMKRWNMLFYIWGVFRGKRDSCSVDIPTSLNQSYASQDIPLKSRDSNMGQGISSNCGPAVQDMRSSTGCQMEKLPRDIPFGWQQSSHTIKSVRDTNNAASEGGVSGNITVLDRVSTKEQLSIAMKDENFRQDDDTIMRRGKEVKYLGMVNQVSLANAEMRNEPRGTLETMSLARSQSLGHTENSERRFFPLETKPADTSSPWKIHPSEGDQVNDKSPDLELALWARSKTWSSPTGPAQDDVPASLSLSLSFPFPEREQRSKPKET